MPFISTRVHSVIDYTVGAGLIVSPEVVGLSTSSAAVTFTRALGVLAIAYSLCTDYELGAVKIISMPVHLRVDSAWATILAFGPWVAGFRRKGLRYWLPHALVALTATAIVACSETTPRD